MDTAVVRYKQVVREPVNLVSWYLRWAPSMVAFLPGPLLSPGVKPVFLAG